MLLHKNISNFIKNKIAGHSYNDKEYVQYILELITLEEYIKTWKVSAYFQGFTIDLFKDTYFDEYINLIKEIKGNKEAEKAKNNYTKKDNYLSNWLDFSQSWQLEKWEKIWVELGWKE